MGSIGRQDGDIVFGSAVIYSERKTISQLNAKIPIILDILMPVKRKTRNKSDGKGTSNFVQGAM